MSKTDDSEIDKLIAKWQDEAEAIDKTIAVMAEHYYKCEGDIPSVDALSWRKLEFVSATLKRCANEASRLTIPF